MVPRVKSKQSGTAIYLYGVSLNVPVRTPSAAGVDGKAAVEAIKCGEFVCWASRVPRSEFGDNLAAKMEDLDWLSEASTLHHAATAAIAAGADVLPARFGTVFLSDVSLRDTIKTQAISLRADLKRIRGNEEWGIKVFAAPQPAVPVPAVRSGKTYLQAKSATLRGVNAKKTDDEVVDFMKALAEIAVAMTEGGKISGSRRDLKFQISILAKRSQRKKLEGLLRRFAGKWRGKRTIECTGPWPPYSFVSKIAHE